MKPILYNRNLDEVRSGSLTWSSPSNIALIKYWGKYGNQMPENPSLSFTLSNSKTTTSLNWKYDPRRSKRQVSFLFAGEQNAKFLAKVKMILDRLEVEVPLLKNFKLDFSSNNSFPHSAGIASSASGMSALVLCILGALKEFASELEDTDLFFRQASHLARLASGSAARSVYGGVTTWGKGEHIESSQYYAAPLSVNKIFKSFYDSIVIISAEEKAVSSSAGHDLMKTHPYRQQRFSTARSRLITLLEILQTEELMTFCELVETEALDLHGLMMTSSPSFILMKPGTLKVIELVRSFRKSHNLPLCFTLDAGPNVHLLYPAHIKERVEKFIDEQIATLAECQMVINDRVGDGPEQLN